MEKCVVFQMANKDSYFFVRLVNLNIQINARLSTNPWLNLIIRQRLKMLFFTVSVTSKAMIKFPVLRKIVICEAGIDLR